MKKSEFVLRIELGNDAMLSPFEVAGAIQQVARALKANGFADCPIKIRDENGNTVGEARVR